MYIPGAHLEFDAIDALVIINIYIYNIICILYIYNIPRAHLGQVDAVDELVLININIYNIIYI